ncbi:chromosome partitioning protein [Gammaproteobacteria bacterium]
MCVITIANQKGGVGKTTTAVTLAHGLALKAGMEVLLVDLDSQGNVSDALGIEKGPALKEWLIDGKELVSCAVNARPRLDVIRADKSTYTVKQILAARDFRENVLADALVGYERRYDVVVMDSAPSVDVLHMASLVASDYLIAVTKLDQFSTEGVMESLKSLESALRATKSRCAPAGIIPTFYDKVTNESQAQLMNLAETYNGLVWPPIAQDTSCREASRLGKTLWEMPHGRAITGYAECLERLIKII